MKKSLLIVSVLTFMSSAVLAQTEPEQKEPSKIRVYQPETSAGKSGDNSYKWAVKTDLLAFVTGEFPLIGEYRISKKFSVEASAGITFGFLPNSFASFVEEEETSAETKAAMGSAFRGTFKFYPSSDYDALEGWSFGIQLFTKTTNRDYDTENISNPQTYEGKQDVRIKTGASLIIAKQIFQDSNIAFEYILGVGMANVSREYTTESFDYNTNLYSSETVKTENIRPNVQLGFRIGFGN